MNLLNIIKHVKEREELKMRIAEINQYLFEVEICKTKSDRMAIEEKFKKLEKNYQKPKIGTKKPIENKENNEVENKRKVL